MKGMHMSGGRSDWYWYASSTVIITRRGVRVNSKFSEIEMHAIHLDSMEFEEWFWLNRRVWFICWYVVGALGEMFTIVDSGLSTTAYELSARFFSVVLSLNGCQFRASVDSEK